MAKIALNMKGISDADASEKAALAVTNCSGTQLANPAPAEVAALQAAQEGFDAALADQAAKQQAAIAATEAKNAARLVLEAKYSALGKKVETIGEGEAAFITARGFAVVTVGGPVLYGQVTNMVATPGDGEGKADWMCGPQKGAIYLLQTSPDVEPRVWTSQEPSRTSSGTISGLPSLTRVWIRAAAKGSNNTGGWSDPALVVVP